jgi:diguanylate cyclase (GGDEF)-like protein
MANHKKEKSRYDIPGRGSTHPLLPWVAISIALIAWAALAFFIFPEGLDGKSGADILQYFLSTEQSGIRFRSSMLLGPFVLALMACLLAERTRLFNAKTALQKRSADLEKINEILTRENQERREAEEQLTRQAFYDPLTRLPNRALFTDHLQNALERRKRSPANIFAVFFLDIDRFKVINDGLGHIVGDQLLIQVSQRLRRHVRSSDTVARFGGDEFAILMEDAGEITHVNDLANRINADTKSSFHVLGHEIFLTVSIGIALSSASDYERTDDLMRDADIAMYQAKARGKACHVIFDATMHAEAATALRLETDLRRAVEKNEFTLHFQPIIEMANDKIIGFEALVRWQHPIRGLITPTYFIKAAEETGLIIPLGQWVIREACRKMSKWQRQFPVYRDLTISVNISGKVFSQPGFYEVIEDILRETGLAAPSLRLEIVESMLIENPEPAAALLKRLNDMKIRFDIDDFGTGYSALNYLRHLPINGLKIDRSFIEAMNSDKSNTEIVRTIIALAHSLDLDVIAEGIETTEQLEIFRTMKGGYAQGFFIARPMDSEAVEGLLSLK